MGEAECKLRDSAAKAPVNVRAFWSSGSRLRSWNLLEMALRHWRLRRLAWKIAYFLAAVGYYLELKHRFRHIRWIFSYPLGYMSIRYDTLERPKDEIST